MTVDALKMEAEATARMSCVIDEALVKKRDAVVGQLLVTIR